MAFYYFDVLSFSAWHTEYVEIVCAKNPQNICNILFRPSKKNVLVLRQWIYKKKGQGR
jgi:hypothetical protein